MSNRLLLALLALCCLGTAPQAFAHATVCSINFTPESGGPGTLVRIEAKQCYRDGPFFLQPGRSDPNTGEFQPIGKPLPTINQRGDAYFSTTVTIPTHLPDGSRITNRNLTLRVTDKYGNDIAEGGTSIFTITPSDLPQTGYMVDSGWLPVLMAAALMLVGWLLSRKLAGLKR